MLESRCEFHGVVQMNEFHFLKSEIGIIEPIIDNWFNGESEFHEWFNE